MFFTIRRLFWFTAFCAIYAATFAKLGAVLTVASLILGFGLMAITSWAISAKHDENEQLGWDILFTCFAIPALYFLFNFSNRFGYIHD